MSQVLLALHSKMGQLRSCGWAEKSRRLTYCGEVGSRCAERRDRALEDLESQRKYLPWFPNSLQLLVPGLGRTSFLWVSEKPVYAPEDSPFCLNWLLLDKKPHCPYCPSRLGPNDPCSGKTFLTLSARVTISYPVFLYYHIPLYLHNHPKQPWG